VLPIVNPDGVVTGNYRSNLQGKDMNRNFYSDDDKDCKERCFEVEMLRAQLKSKFSPELTNRFKMFLDIHAHSCATSIFTYAP
jgi:cytosolic carboxypeptidase protein 2/3